VQPLDFFPNTSHVEALALLRLDRLDGDLTVDGRPVRADPASGVEP
jgi:hypothetical protein